MISDADFHAAWDRVARSADGHTIYLHLQKRLMGVVASSDDSTLREDNGERKFAARLIGLMAQGIEASASGLAASTITFSVNGPRAVARPGGAGRRITADTHVAGWSQPVDSGPDQRSDT